MNPDFLDIARQVTGSEYDAFIEAMDQEPSLSVRHNPFKLSGYESSERVPWAECGHYLTERPQFTLDPRLHGGGYYVQEASSMFVEVAIKSYLSKTDGRVRALDMCAAPGGKTTLLATLIGERGMVVANEVISARAAILKENVMKWGTGNIVVTNSDPKQFSHMEGMFDILVVDAPCSGEGMFRKNREAREQWSLSNVELCSARSRRIIADALPTLREGGLLIYSTCTFNRAEDEQTVEWIASNFDVEGFDIGEVDSTITKTEASGIDCYRFLFHKTRGEGLFLAAMVKKGNAMREEPRVKRSKRGATEQLSAKDIKELRSWLGGGETREYITAPDDTIYSVDQTDREFVEWLRREVNLRYSGVEMGKLFKGELKPAHPLALYYNLSDRVNRCELSLEDALEYLRRKDIPLGDMVMGLNLLCYQGLPIGFAKRIGSRYNTLLPQNMRILK